MTYTESSAHGLSAVSLTPSKQLVSKRVLFVSESRVYFLWYYGLFLYSKSWLVLNSLPTTDFIRLELIYRNQWLIRCGSFYVAAKNISEITCKYKREPLQKPSTWRISEFPWEQLHCRRHRPSELNEDDHSLHGLLHGDVRNKYSFVVLFGNNLPVLFGSSRFVENRRSRGENCVSPRQLWQFN